MHCQDDRLQNAYTARGLRLASELLAPFLAPHGDHGPAVTDAVPLDDRPD